MKQIKTDHFAMMMRTGSVHVTFERTIASIFRHFKYELGRFLSQKMIAVDCVTYRMKFEIEFIKSRLDHCQAWNDY